MIEEGEVVERATSPVVPPNPAGKEEPTMATSSTVPTSPVVDKATMSFPMAMQKMKDGKKITKLEWKDKKIYGFFSEKFDRVILHKEDDKDYVWAINGGDLKGEDFVVID